MRFHTFLKEIDHPDNDPDILAFVKWTKKQQKLQASSDPRILGFFYYKKLNHQLTRGFQKAFMVYFSIPENQLPKDLKNNDKEFLSAINSIIHIQNNDPEYSF